MSRRASRGQSGALNHNWKGGRRTRRDGYVMVRVGGREVLEHRLVMARLLGRDLQTGEHVHHKNHDRGDNRPENLELLSHAEHSRLHAAPRRGTRGKASWTSVACTRCGMEMARRIIDQRDHPRPFCGRECYRQFLRGMRERISSESVRRFWSVAA